MAPAGSVWEHKSDKDLLLTIIDQGSLQWPTISDKMQAKGYTFTKEACRQHFQKIRREARNGSGNDGGSSPIRNSVPKVTKANGSAKSTPRKPKSMTDSFSTKNSSFANSNGSFANGNGYEDDDEEMTTPVKRKRTMKDEGLENDGRNALVFKQENQGGQESPIDLEHEELYEHEDGYA